MPSLLSILAPTTALTPDAPPPAPRRKEGEATADSTPFDALLAAAVAGFAFQPQPLPTPPVSATVFTVGGSLTPVSATILATTASSGTTAVGSAPLALPTVPDAVAASPISEPQASGSGRQAVGTDFGEVSTGRAITPLVTTGGTGSASSGVTGVPVDEIASLVSTTTGITASSPQSIEALNAVGADSRAIIASSTIQTRPLTQGLVTAESLGATVRTLASVPTAVLGNGAGVLPLTAAGVPTTPGQIAAAGQPALAEQPSVAVAAGQPTLFVPASRNFTAPVLVATSQPASVPVAETDARPFVVPTGIDRPAEPVSQAAALRAVTTSPTGLPLTVGERAEAFDSIAATKRAERNDGSAAPAAAFTGFLERTVAAGPAPTNASSHPTPVDQIAEGMLVRADVVASGGRTEFRLQLNPPNLGPVDVRIHSTPAGLRAELVSADPAVRQMIESQLPELRHRLEAAGLNVSGFDVSAGDADRRGRRERDDETSDTLRPPRRPSSSRPFIAPRTIVGGAVLDVTA